MEGLLDILKSVLCILHRGGKLKGATCKGGGAKNVIEYDSTKRVQKFLDSYKRFFYFLLDDALIKCFLTTCRSRQLKRVHLGSG